jgi:DNA repair and recombination protein RAD52
MLAIPDPMALKDGYIERLGDMCRMRWQGGITNIAFLIFNTEGITIKEQQVFNPKAESPSIRKTEGFDHSSSKPIARTAVVVQPPVPPQVPSNNGTRPPAGMQQQAPRPGNVVNPHLDLARQVGIPGGRGSPMANRHLYKTPTMKRPLEAGGGNARAALVEVAPNAGVGPPQNVNGLDPKRQKMS